MKLDLKLRILHADEVAIGPGKADLLEAIAETGSISAAARSMDMSYRRAWLLVDVMNRSFKEALVLSAAGGSHGGGAQLTDTGAAVLAQYRKMQQAAEKAADKHIAHFQAMLK